MIVSEKTGLAVGEGACLFTGFAHPRVSDKYVHVNTAEVVSKFAQHGWVPVRYKEARTRKFQGFQTHTVELMHENSEMFKVGDSSLRIIIVNNHHAASSLQLKLGLFRLVCSNGLVVSDSEFNNIRIRHMGVTLDEQIAGFVDRLAVVANRLKLKIDNMKNWQMSVEEMRDFAKKALALRFEEVSITEEMTTAVLRFKRAEDSTDNAWNVFNRVQENIIRGFRSDDRERSIRRIASVKRDIQINEQLWDLLAA